MTNDLTKKLIKGAKIAINPTGAAIDLIVQMLENSILETESAVKRPTGLTPLDVEKQELEMRMAAAHARVSQELAIARRIETAEEVEMEEYYDNSGEASLGVQTDGLSLSAGVSGSGRRVTKRVYRFRGNTSIAIDTSALNVSPK